MPNSDHVASPRVYLAVDNCFASKRWPAPIEWARLVADLGLTYIEASADTECDPLYGGSAYLADWVRQVRAAEDAVGVKVANLYSGHGTYATLGLGHPDSRVRARMLRRWVQPMARMAGRLGAGLGFFCHAFCEAALQSEALFRGAVDDLYALLAEAASYAAAHGVRAVGIEQMYTPHQVPWTLGGAVYLMRKVLALGGQPLHITIDTGHQVGQGRRLRPCVDDLRQALGRCRAGAAEPGLWLGPASAYQRFREALAQPQQEERALLEAASEEMDRCPHLFATAEDGDPYQWLGRLGCYSPIIHLQQTTGQGSAHLPFTPEHNRRGLIQAERVLEALASSYSREPPPGLPPRCAEVYLTLEIFAGTADVPAEILQRLQASVAYWRQYVPEDGRLLSELTAAT